MSLPGAPDPATELEDQAALKHALLDEPHSARPVVVAPRPDESPRRSPHWQPQPSTAAVNTWRFAPVDRGSRPPSAGPSGPGRPQSAAARPGSTTARPGSATARSLTRPGSADDPDACWICLSGTEEGPLSRPCRCPRKVHVGSCLQTWQRANIGTRKEMYCEFCGDLLPDWRRSIPRSQLFKIRFRQCWRTSFYALLVWTMIFILAMMFLFLYFLGREAFGQRMSTVCADAKGNECASLRIFLYFTFGVVLGMVVGTLSMIIVVFVRLYRRWRFFRAVARVQPAPPPPANPPPAAPAPAPGPAAPAGDVEAGGGGGGGEGPAVAAAPAALLLAPA